MKQRRRRSVAVALLLALSLALAACAAPGAATKVRVLIIPKFEVGDISGDFPGEAQLFYERYLEGCDEIEVPNAPPTTDFYMNAESGVGLLVTGSGKAATALSTMALLGWDAYDFSDATIVSVGCGGGSTGTCTLGDVVVATAVCDYELGHRTDSSELSDPGQGTTWFHDSSFDDYSCHRLNAGLCEAVFELVRDTPLHTTDTCRRVLAANFGDAGWAMREPRVMKGTVVSGDAYWKGTANHEDARFIARYYGCPDEYAVTEMEDVVVMDAARCFGLEDRVVCLRVVVNLDTFLKGEAPESLWADDEAYADMVGDENAETLDAFEVGMENLFDVGSPVIDAALAAGP